MIPLVLLAASLTLPVLPRVESRAQAQASVTVIRLTPVDFRKARPRKADPQLRTVDFD